MATIHTLDLMRAVNQLYRDEIPTYGDPEWDSSEPKRIAKAFRDGVISNAESIELMEHWDSQFDDALNMVVVECRQCHKPFPADAGAASGRFMDQFCSTSCEDRWYQR